MRCDPHGCARAPRVLHRAQRFFRAVEPLRPRALRRRRRWRLARPLRLRVGRVLRVRVARRTHRLRSRRVSGGPPCAEKPRRPRAGSTDDRRESMRRETLAARPCGVRRLGNSLVSSGPRTTRSSVDGAVLCGSANGATVRRGSAGGAAVPSVTSHLDAERARAVPRAELVRAAVDRVVDHAAVAQQRAARVALEVRRAERAAERRLEPGRRDRSL